MSEVKRCRPPGDLPGASTLGPDTDVAFVLFVLFRLFCLVSSVLFVLHQYTTEMLKTDCARNIRLALQMPRSS